MKRIKNKVAIITGSGQGIGAAIAKKFANEGAKIVINDIDEAKAMHCSNELKNAGFDSIAVAGDVSSGKDVDKIINNTIKKFGRIDILINNAGISFKTKDGLKTPLFVISEDEWDKVLEINLKGIFICSQKISKLMIEQKSGNIVNMASNSAKFGGFGPAGNHYRASKAGVISLTKSLAFDLASYNIRVNAIAPGFIKTEMANKTSEDLNKQIVERIPMKRFGSSEEIAETALFLVSESSSYITGTTLIVDGGYLIA